MHPTQRRLLLMGFREPWGVWRVYETAPIEREVFMKRLLSKGMLLAGLLLAGEALRADVQDMVKLKDGSVFLGTITEEAKDYVVINSKGVSRKVSRDVILSTYIANPNDSQQAADVQEDNREYDQELSSAYALPADEMVRLRRLGLAEDELPTIFFISSKARVHHQIIADLRLGGMAWVDIMGRYRLRPDILYFNAGPVSVSVGDPFYIFSRPRREWRRHAFSDAEILACSNLRFVHERRNIAPARAMQWHREGVRFERMGRSAQHSQRQSHGSASRRNH
jgi:hypothetical protein